MTSEIYVPVSYGEIVDKVTILEIKAERIGGEDRRANVLNELSWLKVAWEARFGDGFGIVAELAAELKATNLKLWTIEDDIRDLERAGDFGERFVELARAVYKTNDKRAEIKRAINSALGSGVQEEKSYKAY